VKVQNTFTAMKPWFAKRSRGMRHAIVAIVIIVVVVVAFVVVRHFLSDPNTGPTKQVADPAPTTVHQPALTSLQAVRAAFQPWHLVQGSDASVEGSFLAMLHESGSIELSAATVDFHPQDWTSTQPFVLRTVKVSGVGVNISTSGEKLFTVGVEQPFIFEQEPQYVYLITDDGTVWQASSRSVKAMQ